MRKKLIYDAPTRIFHWGFASLFIGAFLIAKTVDDDNPAFSYHMLAGLLLGGLVLLRIIWGLVGSKYSRFSSFALNPIDLFEYGKGILTGDKKRWAGHNPASSWATIAMLVFAGALAVTGIFMTNGYKEDLEDFHELLANGFLVTVLLHVAGVAVHALRHQDGIALTMVHGKKETDLNQESIPHSRPIIAVLLITIMGAFGFYLIKNFDTTTNELNLFGYRLILGENESSEDGGKKEIRHESDDGDDD